MSAKTTLAPIISITLAQATNVQAGIIISSVFFNLRDNKIAINPLVHEFVKIAYFFKLIFQHSFSFFNKQNLLGYGLLSVFLI